MLKPILQKYIVWFQNKYICVATISLEDQQKSLWHWSVNVVSWEVKLLVNMKDYAKNNDLSNI